MRLVDHPPTQKTGDCLMFGEWKGAAGIWTVYHSHEELKDSFKQDILELLDLLAANDCPHPYDGTVAGVWPKRLSGA
jgi:hypothetical protein